MVYCISFEERSWNTRHWSVYSVGVCVRGLESSEVGSAWEGKDRTGERRGPVAVVEWEEGRR